MRSVSEACAQVLLMPDPRDKLMAARALNRDWRFGRLIHRFDCAMPLRPARPEEPPLMPPSQMPRRGKAVSDRGRIALLHALAHIEFGAIDLAIDMAGRFGAGFQAAFIDDWLGVAADEALHFALLDRRLRSLGSHYGALPAHDGLWDAASETRNDVTARLAVVPMVLEARGLDVTPATVARFEAQGDVTSARILGRIYRDEIRHVAIGTKWFLICCAETDSDPVSQWKMLVKQHFRGDLKPPFNDSARHAAGLTQEFYS